MSEKVIMGKIIKVANSEKKASENDEYFALHVEDESGKNESCILFTESELKEMETINFPFAAEQMKAGRIYPAVIAKKNTNLVKVIDGVYEKIFRMSKSQLLEAEARAARNTEDIPKKSFFTDLFD